MNPRVRKTELARVTGKSMSKERGRPSKGTYFVNGSPLRRSFKAYAKHL